MTTPIYHFTHMNNLDSIISIGALLCHRLFEQNNLTGRNVAYTDLKQKRLKTPVEITPYGTVGDYVPFYFGTRSPMLLAYTDGYVTGRREKQDEIIYLASTAEHVDSSGHVYVFTDGHPVQEPRAFFNSLSHLNEVDLALMEQKYWGDTDEYPDRKRRRQAEFLVHRQFPWEDVLALGCRTPQMSMWLEEKLAQLPHKPRCLVKPTWYYEGRG